MTKIPAETATELMRPVWLRAAVTAVFAAFTTFWHGNDAMAGLWDGNDQMVGRMALAGFFILTGSLIWDYAKQSSVPAVLRQSLAIGAVIWLLAGIGMFFTTSTTSIGIVAGLGLVGMGLAEGIGGWKTRADFVPARDHILLGAVSVITGFIMALPLGFDLHEVLGTAGMGMILAAVLLLVAAAGMTHEHRRNASS